MLIDVARKKGKAGARYHAAGESGVAFRDIGSVIGRRLNLPVMALKPPEADGHFTSFSHFAQIDAALSDITRATGLAADHARAGRRSVGVGVLFRRQGGTTPGFRSRLPSRGNPYEMVVNHFPERF